MLNDLLKSCEKLDDRQKYRLLVMAHNYPSELVFNEISVLKQRLDTLKNSESGMYEGELYEVDKSYYEAAVHHVCKSIQLLEGLLGVSNTPKYLTMFNLYFPVKRRLLATADQIQPLNMEDVSTEDVLMIEMFENHGLLEYDEYGNVTWLF